MATDRSTAEKDAGNEQTARRGRGPIVWVLLLLFAGAPGLVIPFLLPENSPGGTIEASTLISVEVPSHGDTTTIPFGAVTVNLDEGRMNRYLHLSIVVLIAKADEPAVTAALKQKTVELKNWLLSHLSDKTLDEIRGKAGQNMLRREIRREFNEILFSDRRDRVYDVLFEEFNVQ